jgi:hypothetical protein
LLYTNTHPHSYWDSNCNSHSNSATTHSNSDSAPTHSYTHADSDSATADTYTNSSSTDTNCNTNIYTGANGSMSAATDDRPHQGS